MLAGLGDLGSEAWRLGDLEAWFLGGSLARFLGGSLSWWLACSGPDCKRASHGQSVVWTSFGHTGRRLGRPLFDALPPCGARFGGRRRWPKTRQNQLPKSRPLLLICVETWSNSCPEKLVLGELFLVLSRPLRRCLWACFGGRFGKVFFGKVFTKPCNLQCFVMFCSWFWFQLPKHSAKSGPRPRKLRSEIAT